MVLWTRDVEGPESGGLAVAFGSPGVLILPVGNHGKVFTNEEQRRLAVGAFDTLPLMPAVLIIIINAFTVVFSQLSNVDF